MFCQRSFKTLRLLAILIVATTAVGFAHAQPAQQHPTGWQVTLGAGLLHSPNYTGDDASQLLLAPSIRARFGPHWAISFRQGVQYTVNPQSAWRWGMAVVPFLGRDSDGSSPFRVSGDGTDDLLGFDDVDTTVGLKLFTQYSIKAWSVRVQAQQSTGSDSRGILTLGLNRSGTLKTKGPPLILSGGIRVRLGNQQAIQSLVEVTPEHSAAIGLAPYSPEAGVLQYGINGRAILPLTRSLSLMGSLSIDQLAAELGDSTLIKERGDPLQVSVGLFLNYRLKSL